MVALKTDFSCSDYGGIIGNCGSFVVDVNGADGPNTIGKDFFYFHITKTGVKPYGITGDASTCDANYGTGCAAKVLLGQ